jgi:hypothetical protein
VTGSGWGVYHCAGARRGPGVGAVAQLVAHHTGSVGVRGSSPLGSTHKFLVNALIVEVDDQGVDHLPSSVRPTAPHDADSSRTPRHCPFPFKLKRVQVT